MPGPFSCAADWLTLLHLTEQIGQNAQKHEKRSAARS